jgi:outer membrane protein assembly factor BamE (lipoprotein component of BamABCDE complex)
MKILVVLILFSFFSCQSASKHRESLGSTHEQNMTVGLVQKEIKKGMSAASVAEVLGSPNIVTTDENGDEVWVYDKIATEASYSNSSGGIGGGIGAATTSLILGGLVGGNYSSSAGASSTTQRTLTVIIKFNEDHQVRDFAYHASKF